MTIKILHAADIHIHLYKPKVPVEWQLNRFKLFFEKMLELEKSHDLVVLAGDIFDKKPEPDEMTLFNAYLNKVTKPTIIIPGNHEASKKGETFLQGYVRDEAINNHNVSFFTKNARINFMGYWIQMFPYTEVQMDNLEDHSEKDILITHIRGEVPPNITPEYDFNKLRGYPLVLLGDLHFYHKYQDYNIFYPGSPLNVSFDRSDARQYGVLSHTYWKEGHTHTFIDLKLPRLLRKKVSAGTELVKDPINHVIYEVEGKLEDIQKVKPSELLDKKIVDLPNSISALDLKNKTLLEEIATYLEHIAVDNIKDYLNDLHEINITNFDSVATKSSSDIKLLNMSFSDMYSFGKNISVDFTKNKVTQLDAVNGSGKTALMLILQELLTSKNMKGIKKGDIANRYINSKNWDAKLTMLVDNVPHSITINRKGDTSKVALFRDGDNISEHKIPDTYKVLGGILNTTPEVLNQLIYQSSTSQLEFLKATDTNRKKFLVGLFSLERYLQIGEVLKGKISTVEKTIAGLQGQDKTVKDFLSSQSNLGEKKTTIDVPEVDDNLKVEITKLESELLNINNQCIRIDKNNLLIKELSELVFDVDLQDIDEVQLNDLVKKRDDIYAQIKSLEQDNIKANKELSSVNTATHCPTCKQPIDNSHAVIMVSDLNTRISNNKIAISKCQADLDTDLVSTIDKLKTQRSQFVQNQRKIERFEQLHSLIDKTLPTTHPKVEEIKTDLVSKKAKLQNQVASRAEAIKYNSDVDILNAKIDMLITQKREFLVRQELLNSDIITTQSQLNRLTILRKAFSPTGLVAYKLENIIKEFETEINNYLIEFSDGQFQINFRLEGEKLNIIVFNNGVESPIENVSEGEFSRIQTSTLLAIRKLLSKLGGIKINFVFFDEVMGVLDQAGKDKLIEMLEAEEDTNTFIVAHGYSNPLVPKLTIVKENNIARIV